MTQSIVNSQLSLVNSLDWLYSTQAFGIKLGLEGITRLLEKEELAFEFYQDFAGLDRIFYAYKIK